MVASQDEVLQEGSLEQVRGIIIPTVHTLHNLLYFEKP